MALTTVRSKATAVAMRVVSCGMLTLMLCSVSVAGYSAGFDQVLLSLRALSASCATPAFADRLNLTAPPPRLRACKWRHEAGTAAGAGAGMEAVMATAVAMGAGAVRRPALAAEAGGVGGAADGGARRASRRDQGVCCGRGT